jgi:DNA-binding transcriptional regulator GbsR (MarR family)
MASKRSEKTRRVGAKGGSGVLPRPVRAFVDAAGAFIEHWGFKRVQGQIWALVYLADRPLMATEVARALGVSKALVSLAMSELLEYRVLLLADGGDGRSQRLVANENLGEAITAVLRLRETRLLEDARASVVALRSMSPDTRGAIGVDRKRVAAVEQFIQEARRALDLFVVSMNGAA